MANQRRDIKKTRSAQAKAARLAAERRARLVRVIAIVAAIAVAFTSAGIFLGAGSEKDGENADEPTTPTTEAAAKVVPPGKSVTGDTPCPPAEGAERTSNFEKAPPMCIDPNKTYVAEFDTTEGLITVALDTKRTPQTTNNFVVLSRYKYYDGSDIFRTDPSIDIIQGGGPNTQTAGDRGPGYNITDEGGKFEYTEGDLVMARAQGPNSAGAQFFIATGPNVASLNGQGTYVTFGKITGGLDVAKKIIGLHQPTSGGLGGKPSRTVTVNKVTIKES